MFKKVSAILAVFVSLVVIYQGAGMFCSSYAKASDLSSLKIEVKIHALQHDVQYVQDRIWDMEDRYGCRELIDKDKNIPSDIIHKYDKYKKRLDDDSELLQELMKKRLGDLK